MKKKFSILDTIIIMAAMILVGYILYRLNHSLNYSWNWAIIPSYLLHYNEQTETWQSGLLLQGFFTTIRLSIWGTLLAALLGVMVGMMSISRRLFLRLSARTYVELIRNIPALVLVFIFYFFVSDQLIPLLHIDRLSRSLSGESRLLFSFFLSKPEMITQFLSGVITLGLFQGAYIAEIVRGGIQSIEKGQWEASAALGLTSWQQMRRVILPQAIKNMLPPLANEFINTIKYSSIVSVISIQELTFQGMQVMASTQVTIEVWITITAMYLVLCLFLSMFVNRLEYKLSQGRF
ncbi:amino acid ABC transporter permease [Desulfopila inferna]|uniref:amino acid ABC transporter permease n=1 Tax=Desulfopila inferna TaxID=468528 RepID=UPI001F058491|nr:amino acid ABC transporter permease [Desulfopila inferna]